MKRIRALVDLTYKKDPRVAAFKEEFRRKREAEKEEKRKVAEEKRIAEEKRKKVGYFVSIY